MASGVEVGESIVTLLLVSVAIIVTGDIFPFELEYVQKPLLTVNRAEGFEGLIVFLIGPCFPHLCSTVIGEVLDPKLMVTVTREPEAYKVPSAGLVND